MGLSGTSATVLMAVSSWDGRAPVYPYLAPVGSRGRPGNSLLRRELEHDAPRPRALLLDLRDLQAPDLAGIGDVGAAAGLQVHAVDLEEADAPHAARRLDRHRAHELRLGVELRVRDPDRPDVVRLVDQAGELALEVLPVEGIDHVEIEPRVAGGDRAAVRLVRHDRAEEVGRRVEAHVPVPPIPVDA